MCIWFLWQFQQFLGEFHNTIVNTSDHSNKLVCFSVFWYAYQKYCVNMYKCFPTTLEKSYLNNGAPFTFPFASSIGYYLDSPRGFVNRGALEGFLSIQLCLRLSGV